MKLKMFDCGTTILLIFEANANPIFRIRVSRARLARLGAEIQNLLTGSKEDPQARAA